VTNGPTTVTNETEAVTAGAGFAAWLHRLAAWPKHRALLMFWCLGVVAQTAVNGWSMSADFAQRGIAIRPVEPWIWEFSSAVGLVAWLLPVLMADEALRKATSNALVRLGAWALMSVAFSLLHVITMVTVRHGIYALAGWSYDFGPWVERFAYEYRKDVLTFVLLLGTATGWRMWCASHASRQRVPQESADTASVGAPAGPDVALQGGTRPGNMPTFLVRTSAGDLLVRAEEIDWVEAQGNYVALHMGNEVRLLRRTLAQTEARLKDHGFIRTHRRALVNRTRMRAILPAEVGDAGVRLSSGQIAPLSESRRSEVVRLVIGAG
jgi:hypothetical protein